MEQMDINKLWQNFVDTITKHYVDFDGRVGRAQFWYYILVYAVIAVAVSIVGGIVGSGSGLRSLYSLALLCPTLGFTARRLHDTGRTANWVFILAVPWVLTMLLGILVFASFMMLGFLALLWGFASLVALASLVAAIIIIYLCAQPGTAGPNQYGPVPPVWTPGATAAPPPAPAAG
ncbi:MAG TPA: DUF805 domain-containing protein [Rhizomicrobium sp.]|jgi:uncharacterized membrane protein YhaH (DUF805 family)